MKGGTRNRNRSRGADEKGTEEKSGLLWAEHLVKRFGPVTAVDDISFHLRRGEIFGFLGPNGAGKTTTINLLTGLARPTSGRVYLDGREYSRNAKIAQASMGIVQDDSNLYDELDGFKNLTFCGALYGMERDDREARARELLGQLGLADAAGRPFRTYSKGMKRRLTIAAGIIHRPAVLFLDEPTTGVDVASARQIRTLIAELNDAGTTVFLTTHYIEEAERLCHRIAFIVRGKIVRIGTLEELVKQHQHKFVLELGFDETGPRSLGTLERRFPAYELSRPDNSRLRVVSESPIDLLTLLGAFADAGAVVTEAKLIRPSLEDVLSQASEHQLGTDLSLCLDVDVLPPHRNSA